ncbi:MAG: hypothetical protein IKE57_00945 [Oscillospiraceae bacterium]|nr:hypothetical protein [Oscillospiraceae bacterium]
MKTNKLIRRLVCLTLAAVLIAALLSGCGGKPKGTYKASGLVPQTFTFSGDSVTMSAFGIEADGTYEIKGDKIYITYSLLGFEYTWDQSFRRSGKDIIIGGTLFEKE